MIMKADGIACWDGVDPKASPVGQGHMEAWGMAGRGTEAWALLLGLEWWQMMPGQSEARGKSGGGL